MNLRGDQPVLLNPTLLSYLDLSIYTKWYEQKSDMKWKYASHRSVFCSLALYLAAFLD